MKAVHFTMLLGLQACQDPPPAAVQTTHLALEGLPSPPVPAGVVARLHQGPAGACGGNTHEQALSNSWDWTYDPDGDGQLRGSPVLAVAEGTVTHVHTACADNGATNCLSNPNMNCNCNHGLGNEVVIDHGGGLYSAYLHLHPGSLRVRVGDRVCRGMVIAGLGHTGVGSGPHLHFHMQDVPGNLFDDGGRSVPFDGFTTQAWPACGNMQGDQAPVDGCAPPDWWCAAIGALNAAGILERRCADVAVGDAFNRAAWGTAISRTLRLEQAAAYGHCQNPFADVPAGEWFEDPLVTLAWLEFDDGVAVYDRDRGVVEPGRLVNRCEAAKTLVEAWDLSRGNGGLLFTDAIPDWCLPYVEKAVTAGLFVNRMEPFRPGDALSIGEGAVLLQRAMEGLGRNPPPANAFGVGCGGRPVELCNGRDEDGDGRIDEGPVCAAPDECREGRCTSPGQPEACNGADDDRDGRVDEGNLCPDGPCQGGRCGGPPPATELCNGQDDDQDGRIDEGNLCPAEAHCRAGVCSESPAEACNGADDDQDGVVDEQAPCAQGQLCEAGACRNSPPSDDPNAERCNGQDDDQDGRVDEATCGTGAECRAGRCEASGVEACNGGDDDADGLVDEGAACGLDARCQGGRCVADPPSPARDAGVVDEESNASDGGCSATGRPGGWSALGVLAAALFVRRRRRTT